MHYNIDEAGVWTDAFHQQKPVIHNDYAALPLRKGLPEGHAKVLRQLVVPVLRDQKVVSILGIGNKPYEYDENNIELVSNVADLVWTIVSYKRAEENLLQTQNQLMEQQRTIAAIEERQRLARDLHDSVNQSIHSTVLFSETLTAVLEKNNRARAMQIAGRLQESARQAIKEVRLMLYELQTTGDIESTDLLENLEYRLNSVERRAGVQAEIILEGSLDRCSTALHQHLFWIIIEALNNAIKHAQARRVQIFIRCTPQATETEIVDNGIGFNPEKLSSGGMGLRNMHQRAALLGGELTIDSASTEGTRVCFRANHGMDVDP